MARVPVPEPDLRAALVALKNEHPALGVAKLHASLLQAYPTWAVSEKRVRKILQSEGLVAGESSKDGPTANHTYPVSQLNQSLDVTRWTRKVKVHYFSAIKGKGLVATEKISEGEIVWREDPFILAPEWDIYDLQKSSRACGFCSTLLGNPSPLHLPCPASTSSTHCPAVFCNRRCRAKSEKVHSLLCPGRNPASIALLKFARENEWMALHALAHCTSRLLLSFQRDDGSFSDDFHVVQGLAVLGMEERFRALRDKGVEPDREIWKKAHELYLAAFDAPKSSEEQKKLARILKRPLPESTRRDLFAYDAFLRGLGRMSLSQCRCVYARPISPPYDDDEPLTSNADLEGHGGLYALHSHLNHACAPNMSVRHLDPQAALARITVLAKTAIEPGEELLITYVDPQARYRERQRRLLEWGFGDCRCARCLAQEGDASVDAGADSLAEELRAGLGLA